MANTEEDIIDLTQLTAADLQKEEVQEKIAVEMADQKRRLTADAAKNFWRDLKPLVEKIPADQEELKQKYQDYLADLEMIALSVLGEPDLRRALQEHVLRVFGWEDYDLIREFDSFVMAKYPITLRDKFKKEIKRVLQENEEEITSKHIENVEGKKVAPTVKNWLLDYEQNLGAEEADPLKKTEYLYQGINAKNLPEQERKKLIKLIDFYEHLKKSSEHPLGVEEKFVFIDADRLVEVDHGDVIDLGPTVETIREQEKIDTITIRHPRIKNFLEKEKENEEPESLDEGEVEKKPILRQAQDYKKFVKPDPMKVVFDKQPKPIPRPSKQPSLRPSLAEAEKKIAKAKKKPQPVTVPQPVTPSVPHRRTPSLPQFKRVQKAVVSDIKAPQRVMGPLDELEQISLTEFRNLADNPVASAAKIKEKIDLLEEESVEKKATGIKVWKKSPVNQLYIDIGNQSIAQGKSVREIINQREQTAERVLTYAEFEALADLNRELRF